MAEIDMDAVAAELTRRGVPAYVEQTGGGCATIYAGEVFTDERGDGRFPCLAGPGWFDGPGWTNARAAVGDFYVGPDDDGENLTAAITIDDTGDPRVIASVVERVIAHQQQEECPSP